MENAWAVVSYAQATPAEDLARVLAAEDARVVGRKRVSQLSSRALADEAKRIRSTTAGTLPTELRTARQAARAVQKTLRQRGAKDARADVIRNAGKWRIQIEIGPEDVKLVVR